MRQVEPHEQDGAPNTQVGAAGRSGCAALNRAAHPDRPEHATESDVLAEATHLGLLMLASEAAVTGQPIASVPIGTLVQRVRSRLLPVFELLAHHGALPALLTHGLGSAPSVFNAPTPAAPPTPARPPAVSVQAGADVRSLGGGFLDDDDDD